MRRLNIIVCLVFCEICLSCLSFSNQKIAEIVNYWNKRTFPVDSILFSSSKVNYEINKPNGKEKFYIVGYIDSTVCTSCRLEALNKYLGELYSKANGTLGSLLIVSNSISMNTDSVMCSFYNFPYYVDEKKWIESIDNYPSEDLFRTMLLDSEYKVVAIGNPIVSSKMQEIYSKTILGEDDWDLPQTSLSLKSKIVDVGIVKKDVQHSVSIEVCNKGTNDLYFLYVYSTCGCLHANPEKRSVAPNSSTNINATFKTSIKGSFIEKIFLKCNTNDSPIMITIKGIAE